MVYTELQGIFILFRFSVFSKFLPRAHVTFATESKD